MDTHKLTPEEMCEWVPSFLRALTESPNVSKAAKLAGISRRTAYDYRERNAAFAQLWDDALESSTDDLAAEAYRRARHGTEKPVFYLGAECGRIREYSDVLTIFLLKAHRSEIYRETTKQIHDFSNVSDEELIRQAKGIVS